MRKLYFIASLFMAGGLLNAQEAVKTALGQTIIRNAEVSAFNAQNAVEGVTDDDTIWEQIVSEADSTYSIISSYFNMAGWGSFCADDFEVTGDTTVNSILFAGSQSAEDGASYVNGIDVYIFQDEDGKPAGDPSNPETAYHVVNGVDINSEFVDVQPGQYFFLGDKIYFIDLAGLDKSFELPAGIYWVSIVFDLNLAENDFDIRWLWKDSLAEPLGKPQTIAPYPGGGIYNPEWVDIASTSFPIKGLAFSLYGETEAMSTVSVDLSNLNIYPNPAADFIYLTDASVKGISNAAAYSLTGQHFPLKYENGRINVSSLTSGAYILSFQTADGAVVNKKFIKK